MIERAAVVEPPEDVGAEARNLISAAVRRELAVRTVNADTEQIMSDREARVQMEALTTSERGLDAAGWLLGWLEGRMEARTGGA